MSPVRRTSALLLTLFSFGALAILAAPYRNVTAAQPQTTPGTPIAILDRRGEVTPLAGLPEGWFYYDPALSPDAKRVAFVASRTQGALQNEIIIYTLPSGPLVRVATGATYRAPSWVPGTDEIAYARLSSPLDNNSTFVIQKADSGAPAREILSVPVQMTSSTWFPDGKRVVIAHVGTRTQREEKMFVVSLDRPDSLVVIADGNMMNSRPALSPDGKLLAYSAAVPAVLPSGARGKGRQLLHVHRFSDGAQLAIEAFSGTTPVWSANGSDLLFQSGTSPARLYKVRIRAGGALSADPVALTSDYEFDDSGSGFAPLPGDNSFLVRAARPKAAIADVPPRVRGRRASQGDQRQIEFVVARAIVDLAAEQGKSFERFGTNVRAYIPRTDTPWAGFADTAKSYLLPAHIEGHVLAVSKILKSAGIVRDAPTTCVVNGPSACRMGDFAGIVAFSPAITSADSARITVIRTERGASADVNTAPSTSIYWRVVLAKSGAEWAVRSINGIPSKAPAP